jgi:hypothetical protein
MVSMSMDGAELMPSAPNPKLHLLQDKKCPLGGSERDRVLSETQLDTSMLSDSPLKVKGNLLQTFPPLSRTKLRS